MDNSPREQTPTSPAYLPSAGLGEARATKHEFVGYREVDPGTLKFSDEHGPRGVVGRPPRALIYRCVETGVERTWGIE